MSPFRSSAGPAIVRIADAELVADDERERRLAEPRRADEQDVVERLAARLGRLERDRELLLDALLADEVGERRGRSERSSSSSSRLHRRARGTGGSCRPPQRLPHLLLAGRSGSTPRARARRRRASSRARRARRARRGAAARPPGRRGEASRRELLLQLEHDPLRRLLADPGDRLEARRVLAARSRGAARPGSSPRRSRARPSGPIPETESSCSNSSRSSAVGEAVELERVLAHVEVGLDASPRRRATVRARAASPATR